MGNNMNVNTNIPDHEWSMPMPRSVGASIRKQTSTIWVTFARPGIHCYPDAPDDVAYLRSPHRHLFQFKVEITIFHADRELEFHQVKNWLVSLYDTATLQLDHKSCEMIAQELIAQVLAKYDCSNRVVSVTVSEDGECGATLVSDPVRGRGVTLWDFCLVILTGLVPLIPAGGNGARPK